MAYRLKGAVCPFSHQGRMKVFAFLLMAQYVIDHTTFHYHTEHGYIIFLHSLCFCSSIFEELVIQQYLVFHEPWLTTVFMSNAEKGSPIKAVSHFKACGYKIDC